MNIPHSWLMTGLAAAALASGAGAAHATSFPLGPYGARVEHVYFGSNGYDVDGGAGATSASRSYSAFGAGGGAAAQASVSLGDGALHAYDFATTLPCTPVYPLYSCAPGVSVGSHAAMWDTVVFTDIEGQPRELASLIPTSITIDGTLEGESKSARLRTYFGFDSNIDVDTLPWIDISGGDTAIFDTLFVPLDAAPMFIYVELWTYAGTMGVLDTHALADFGNTLHFNWELPDDVAATSASGVFLTDVSAAPEPAAWALMITGFGLAGASLRARRRSVA